MGGVGTVGAVSWREQRGRDGAVHALGVLF